MKRIDLSFAYALAFSIPAVILFLLFIHYIKTNNPVFNILIDTLIFISMATFWILFIKWVENRDIYGNPLNSYEPIMSWRRWYYKLKK